MSQADASRLSYERFLQFERLMGGYGSTRGQPYNAAPIGYCAFALTLFVYSMIMCGATVPVNTPVNMAMGLALFYGGLIQFLCGLFELRIGNNFNALVFCSYAGYWFSLAAFYSSNTLFINTTVLTDSSVIYKCYGIYYLGWTIFTLVLLVAAIRTNAVNISWLFFLLVVFALWTASYFQLWDQNLTRAGGAIGIFTSVVLWYAGFASLIKKDVNHYFNLPVFGLAPKGVSDGNGESVVEVRVQK